MRLLVAFLLASVVLWGQTFRLYLKDGDYQVVREYQVQGERVRYYSTERGDWEEIPVSLVDLEKTEKQRKGKEDAAKETLRQEAEEDQAQRELQREIASVPMETGAYFNLDGKIQQLEAAKYQVITDKKRAALKILSPVPLITGKASVVIDGEHAKFTVHEGQPNFYFRPEREERFGIIRVTPKKNHRLVENISIVPVSNQGFQNRDEIPVFQQQLADNLYKVWPEKPIEAGEYAVVEFDDNGEAKDLQLMVWDFACRPGGGSGQSAPAKK